MRGGKQSGDQIRLAQSQEFVGVSERQLRAYNQRHRYFGGTFKPESEKAEALNLFASGD
jgi:hypothetical protein